MSPIPSAFAEPRLPQTPEELKALVAGKETFVTEMAALAGQLERAYAAANQQLPESVRMLVAIVNKGAAIGYSDGWFGPAKSRYTWDWLATTHNADLQSGIPRERFRGDSRVFDCLDRDRNGLITADDLDWSGSHAYVQQSALVLRLFRQLDAGGDGRVTREDWQCFFERVTRGRDAFSASDLLDALLASGGGFRPGDAPTTAMLLKALFNNELGSLHEGPQIDERAPDFTLTTQDGKGVIHLAAEIGAQPIVLFFGNFTCGPFRATQALVNDVSRRWAGQARFFGIYVREAHPTDGWHMESNAQQGVRVAQPATFAERAGVAQQCFTKLQYAMPLLVDDIDDAVGNAYSGMPARLYVIDRAGKIAYKAGRGPFGLKVGELEQALAMALLDQSLAAACNR